MNIVSYHLAPSGWTHEDPNLFTADGSYGPGWSCFRIREKADGRRLIHDGLIIRDGLHDMKVYDRLPLDPYLIAAVTPADLDPDRTVAAWTPRSFCQAALEYYSREVGEPVAYEHWC